jgi:polar amino acid transport system substrate-binding protein
MFKNKKYLVVFAMFIMVFTTLLSACQPQQVVSTVVVTQEVVVTKEVFVTPEPAKEMTTYERILATHKITIASYNEVPHGYFDPTTGKFSGVDWDIMEYILTKWGVTEINPIVADWSALIPGLQAHRWDLISVGMSITEKREEVIDFSVPEYAYGQIFVVPQGNPKNLKSTNDLPGHRVGAILGSTTYEAALAIEGVEAVPYSTHNDMIIDLVAGRIDVVWCDEIVAGYAQVKNPQPVEIIQSGTMQGVPTGAGFNSDDDDLREAWNKEIEAMKADGTLLKILQNYGLTQASIVP